MSVLIRQIRPDDASKVLEIYGPLCEASTITFELVAPELNDIRGRIEKVSKEYPWLVCERGDGVVGYAYACQHRERAAYRWSVDVSVYVSGTHRGQGIGRALYTALFAILAEQGFGNAYVGITLPNPASVGLHQTMGFQSVGVYRRVGFKLGQWLDVAWFQKKITPSAVPPSEPMALDSLLGTVMWQRAMEKGTTVLNAT